MNAQRDAGAILAEAVTSFARLPEVAGAVGQAAAAITAALRSGGKVIFCGNGGSASDAEHLAAELVGRYLIDRRPWPALALSTNSSAVTAIANDYGFEEVFARQVRGLGRPGDVLIGISTSGRSRNVVNAMAAARETGLATIALVGATAGPITELADIAIRAPSTSTPRIQEMHIAIGHALCELVENALTKSG